MQEVNGPNNDIAGDGSLRTVNLGEKIVYALTIDHPKVSAADRATLIAFYEANRYSSNTIELMGDTYVFQFTRLTKDHSRNGSFFDVGFAMRANKQA